MKKNVENRKKVTWILVITCILAVTTFTVAFAEDSFVCKCKGNKLLFLPIYIGACGNGYIGAAKGCVKKNLSSDDLFYNYLNPSEAQKVVSGASQCEYNEQSGWKCGKMDGSSLPDCID